MTVSFLAEGQGILILLFVFQEAFDFAELIVSKIE